MSSPAICSSVIADSRDVRCGRATPPDARRSQPAPGERGSASLTGGQVVPDPPYAAPDTVLRIARRNESRPTVPPTPTVLRPAGCGPTPTRGVWSARQLGPGP